MPMKLTKDQKYFQLLKIYERTLATMLAPFKNKTAKPAMTFIEKCALEAIPSRDREFFKTEREARKGRYPTYR